MTKRLREDVPRALLQEGNARAAVRSTPIPCFHAADTWTVAKLQSDMRVSTVRLWVTEALQAEMPSAVVRCPKLRCVSSCVRAGR